MDFGFLSAVPASVVTSNKLGLNTLLLVPDLLLISQLDHHLISGDPTEILLLPGIEGRYSRGYFCSDRIPSPFHRSIETSLHALYLVGRKYVARICG